MLARIGIHAELARHAQMPDQGHVVGQRPPQELSAPQDPGQGLATQLVLEVRTARAVAAHCPGCRTWTSRITRSEVQC